MTGKAGESSAKVFHFSKRRHSEMALNSLPFRKPMAGMKERRGTHSVRLLQE